MHTYSICYLMCGSWIVCTFTCLQKYTGSLGLGLFQFTFVWKPSAWQDVMFSHKNTHFSDNIPLPMPTANNCTPLNVSTVTCWVGDMRVCVFVCVPVKGYVWIWKVLMLTPVLLCDASRIGFSLSDARLVFLQSKTAEAVQMMLVKRHEDKEKNIWDRRKRNRSAGQQESVFMSYSQINGCTVVLRLSSLSWAGGLDTVHGCGPRFCSRQQPHRALIWSFFPQ